jgi:hypothetical protein
MAATASPISGVGAVACVWMGYGTPTTTGEPDVPEPLAAPLLLLVLPLLVLLVLPLLLHAASTALARRASTAPALFAFLVDIIIDLPIS